MYFTTDGQQVVLDRWESDGNVKSRQEERAVIETAKSECSRVNSIDFDRPKDFSLLINLAIRNKKHD